MKDPGAYQVDIMKLEKEMSKLKKGFAELILYSAKEGKELIALKELIKENLEIYRGFMEADSELTQFQKGKNRGAFFAYKNMLDSTNQHQ